MCPAVVLALNPPDAYLYFRSGRFDSAHTHCTGSGSRSDKTRQRKWRIDIILSDGLRMCRTSDTDDKNGTLRDDSKLAQLGSGKRVLGCADGSFMTVHTGYTIGLLSAMHTKPLNCRFQPYQQLLPKPVYKLPSIRFDSYHNIVSKFLTPTKHFSNMRFVFATGHYPLILVVENIL